ncbi:energy-coupling factor transporter transmembrane component T family protein [Plantibacter sp. Mn2098]|uniref:energy-coupling factor transporter transmembrane component T family protein n=1 Tax=Plantibacter sp. Mn2098 TaxID=3395266 RepID=UPI003BED3446
MIALYRPGTSVLHRMPAGPKVLAVMLVVFLVSVLPQAGWALAGAATLAVVGYLIAGLGFGELWRQVLVVRWVIVIMLAGQVIFLPFTLALTNTGRVVAVVLIAALITLTTRTVDLLDAVERGLGPLRRFGVDPARIGLVLAITITAIPVIAGFASTIREAQRARGVPLRPHTFVVPVMVMSMKHADDLGDALVARGFE